MLSHLTVAAFLALPLTQAVLTGRPALAQDHARAPISKHLPSSWYQADDHPVHALFKRQSATDGVTYATVGSQEWLNAYPPGLPDASQMPQEWVDALKAAIAAGKIPDIPQSRNAPDQDPTYPDGLDPTSPKVCSGTYQCQIPGDIWNAPEGYLGCGFDDGPLPTSDKLYQFLQQNNQHVTHFFIGTNILQNPKEFLTAFETLQNDIAVHTWTHPYMTTLSNLDIVAQFGWTMELIHNSTGGRLPKFWRPPYGDTDVRVKAIAHEIFGMTTILWNQDTDDWSLDQKGGTSMDKINTSMTKWLTGPKNPGLIILEHELSDQAVQAFMSAYPVMKSNGWNVVSAAQLSGAAPYQNSPSSNGPVTPAKGVIVGDFTSSTAPSSTTATSTTSPSSTSLSISTKGTKSSKTGSAVALQNGVSSSWMLTGIVGAMVLAVATLFA